MIKNNNPGNIRHVSGQHWLGEQPSGTPFCRFDTLYNGYRALLKLLLNYTRKGLNTIEGILYRYAPIEENDTEQYISFVSKELKIPRDRALTVDNLFDMVRSITKVEHSIPTYSANLDFINNALRELKHQYSNNQIIL